MYVVDIMYDGIHKQQKVLCSGHGRQQCSLVYRGTQDGILERKVGSTLSMFSFVPGDTLLMTAYANGYKYWITDAPTASQTYEMKFGMHFPCPGLPALVYGNRTYNTVQIGTQCWMKENLNIGIMVISNNTSSAHSECSNNGVIEKYCWNNDTANCNVLGGYYDWDEMMQYTTVQGVQGICPTGWHLPTNAEFCTMTVLLDSTVICTNLGPLGNNIGGKLKDVIVTSWNQPNLGATNESGFSAIGTGNRWSNGGFSSSANALTSFWVSTPSDATHAYSWSLTDSQVIISRGNPTKNFGQSVRCLKDQ